MLCRLQWWSLFFGLGPSQWTQLLRQAFPSFPVLFVNEFGSPVLGSGTQQIHNIFLTVQKIDLSKSICLSTWSSLASWQILLILCQRINKICQPSRMLTWGKVIHINKIGRSYRLLIRCWTRINKWCHLKLEKQQSVRWDSSYTTTSLLINKVGQTSRL